MNNGRFNCVASQVLILQQGWEPASALLNQLYRLIAANTRPGLLPGADNRVDRLSPARPPAAGDSAPMTLPLIVANTDDDPGSASRRSLVRGCRSPALRPDSAESFLRQAIGYANQRLQGTLGPIL